MEGRASDKLNRCRALGKWHRSVLNDAKMEKASSTQPKKEALLIPPPPGFGHNIKQQLDKAWRLLTALAAHPASWLAQPSPELPPHTMPGHHTRGHYEPAAFLSEIKPFPEGTALSQASPAAQTNSVLLERWQTSAKTLVLVIVLPWGKTWGQSLKVQSLYGTLPPASPRGNWRGTKRRSEKAEHQPLAHH